MEKKISRGKKISRSQNGEMHTTKEHKISGNVSYKDRATKAFSPEALGVKDETVCEVGATVERTIQPQPYEALKIGVSCRLPCSFEELESGRAFRLAHAMCRKELQEQLARGIEGLESPFEKA